MRAVRRRGTPVHPFSFFADRRGTFSQMMAFAAIALVGIGALAVDYARAVATQTELQTAADSAALAAKADPSSTPEEIESRARAFFQANAKRVHGATISDVRISLNDAAIVVEATAEVDNSFGAILGSEYTTVRVRSEAVAATTDLEVAVVLDNTGSMQDYMDELRDGASDLVATLFDNAGTRSKLKVAVVPYVGAVNIGNHPSHRLWMDENGDARHHAETIEWRYFGYEPGCTYTPGDPVLDPGTGVQGSLWDRLPSFATIVDRLNPIAAARAATAGDVPSPYMFAPDCWIAAPEKIKLFDYFDAMQNTEWKGCVEARAEPFDVTDEVPSNSNADTKFVPWFWPDEIDNAALIASGWSLRTVNDYIPDRLDLRNATFPKFVDPDLGWGFGNVIKYPGAMANVDEVGPDTSGPNKACPDPILPLTDNEDDVTSMIGSLMHWHGSGTNVAEGLAWGWRVLSPQPPFSEGKPYGKSKKVIVLMTDGVNNVNPVPETDQLSEYSAYGYLQQWGWNRIANKTYAGFKSYADSRLQQVCTNAKAEGIEIYTVAFGITEEATLEILRDCATAPPYAYTASTAEELVGAFRKVAGDLTQLRLAK